MFFLDVFSIIFWVHFVNLQGNADEDVLIVTGKGYCITNSSSAIGLNVPFDEETKQGSIFYPRDSNSEMDCDFELNNVCSTKEYWIKGTNWNIFKQVNDGIYNPLITDKRWEELEIIKTLASNEYQEYHNVKDLKIENSEKFQVSFSVRTQHDAHVFLCEKSYPPNTNCYWIMLGYNKGESSGIRKCKDGYINKTMGYPVEPCKTVHAQKNIDNIVGEDHWTHFSITGGTNSLSVFRNSEKILSYMDMDNNWFKPKYLLLHSKIVSGLWKVHTSSHLFSNATGMRQLGPKIDIKSGRLCISMYIAMCETCMLEIIIKNEEKHVVYKHGYNWNYTWQEVKILKEVPSTGVNMYIYKGNTGSSSPFWALDNFRICQSNEYRYLKSKSPSPAPCENMFGNRKRVQVKKNYKPLAALDCPEDTFGSTCVPCYIFGHPYCESTTYCENVNGSVSCRCMAGYEGNNYCSKCRAESYGHNCSRQCSEHCGSACNNVIGKCSYCKNNFTGPKCDISPEPLFKYAPYVTKSGTDYCEIRIDNFDIPGNWSNLNSYTVEHKILDEGTQWDNSKPFPLNISQSYEIKNLKPETTYSIRLKVNYDNRENENDFKFRKTTNCTTVCIGITSDDVSVQPTNISATILIKQKESRYKMCDITKYSYAINGTTVHNQANFTNVIKKLHPYTFYVIIITHPVQKQVTTSFQTLEGVPSKVKDVISKSIENKVELSWKEPDEMNGILQHYSVTYRLIRRLMCPSDLAPGQIINYTGNSNLEHFTIPGLEYFSVYSYEVRAHTALGASEADTHSINIEAGPFSIEESIIFMYNQTPSVNNVTLHIYFTKIPCDKFRGHILLKIELNCKEKWCNESRKQSVPFDSINYIFFENLFAYTNYNLTVERSRTNTSWELVKFEKFKTMSAAPNSIDSLEITSKDDTMISFRWKAPYPPTGELEQFQVNYECSKKQDTKIFELNENCLWPNYYCGDIKIDHAEQCSVQLYAKNKGKSFPTQIAPTLNFTTEMESPLSPEEISYEWDDNNDLRVNWTHPNATNGILTQFEIHVQRSTLTSFYKIDSIEDYKRRYSYAFKQEELNISWCSEVDISIAALNRGQFKSYPKTKKISTPPNLPGQTFRKTSNTNTTIAIRTTDKDTKNNVLQRGYVLVSEKYTDAVITNLIRHLGTNNKDPDLSSIEELRCSFTHFPFEFVIGNPYPPCSKFPNPPLKYGRNYSISVVFINTCQQNDDFVRISNVTKFLCTLDVNGQNICRTEEDDNSNNGLYALVLLLALPGILFGYWYLKKRNVRATSATDKIPLATVKPQVKVKPILKNKKNLRALPQLVTVHTKRIKIINLEDYVKEVIQTGELETQHNLFPRGLIKPHGYASLEQNMPKNRYKNLMAYDHTRVELKKIPGDDYSDYINANYIDGYKVPRAYIATQGPKPNTLYDFWRMIWQENVQHIIMLANIMENGKKKVEKYWPDINEEKSFENIRVKFISAEIFANFEYRKFNVYNGNAERKLDQLHFTTWPDHGVPMYSQSMVGFLQRILKIPYNHASPILVHCSAGVGRTGTIILSDICLRMAAGEGSVDFLAHLEHLRNQRANLVDNVEQYKLVHLVVLECLFGMRTSLPCNENMKKLVQATLDNNGVENQMQYIDDVSWQDNAMETMLEVDTCSTYPEKNRFSSIQPGNYRIFISCYPRSDHSSSYINAVQVDGFRTPARYIVTQQPMPNTLGDFWRMIVEHECPVIISLNEISSKDPTICQFWPAEGFSIAPVNFIKVQHVVEKHFATHSIVTVLVEVKSREETVFNVNILSMKKWKPNDVLPENISDLLTFREEVEILSRNIKPVVVTCYDGATASGLFIALSFVIDKMNLEQECDVCQAVRSIRHFRKQFVTNEDQYRFLYEAAVSYISGYQSYSNFN